MAINSIAYMDYTKRYLLLIGFMVLYVIGGTLIHESGHMLIAKMLGYHSVLHYGSMNWYLPNGIEGTDKTDSFYITLGGVVLLDTISLLALGILVFRGQHLSRWLFWLLVFFSMLIYRHIVLSLICLGLTIMNTRVISFGSDETEIARYLGVSNSVIGIPLLIAALLSCYVLFFIVLDKVIRLPFLISVGVGGAIGYILWLSFLGPIVLP